MPVVYENPGTARELRAALHREQEWTEKLTETISRLFLERKALREQLALADELGDAMRVDNELLRAEMDKHGMHPERLLED